LNKTALISVS